MSDRVDPTRIERRGRELRVHARGRAVTTTVLEPAVFTVKFSDDATRDEVGATVLAVAAATHRPVIVTIEERP